MRTGLPVSRIHLAGLGSLVFGLTVVGSLVRYAEWFGSWGETSRILESVTVLTYPVSAASAAWIASAPRRKRFSWLLDSSIRSQLRLYGSLTAFLAVAAGGGALSAGVGLYIATATEATFGGPSVLSLVTITCGFAAALGLGVLFGRLLPSYTGPIAAIVVTYATTVTLSAPRTGLYPLAGLAVADARERTYRATEAWMYGVRSLWLLAVAWLLVAIASRSRDAWQVPFGLTCALAAPLLYVGEAGMTVSNSALAPTCHHPKAGVTVCLTAARDHAYTEYWRDVRRVIDDLSPLFPQGVTLREETIDPRRLNPPRPEAVFAFGIIHGFDGDAHVPDREQVQAGLVSDVLLARCSGTPEAGIADRPPANANDVIAAAVFDQVGLPLNGSGYDSPQLSGDVLDYTPVEEFRDAWESASAGSRATWLAANATAVLSCSVDPDRTPMP